MEILLVTEDLPESRSNDHAAYLAQRTQRGSGTTPSLPTSSPQAHRSELEAQTEPAAEAGDERLLTTGAPSPEIRWFGAAAEPGATRTLPHHVDEIPAVVTAGRGDARELVLHGDPRTGQWVSPDTKASRLAPYLDAWRRKIERVGTLNFPSAARRSDLSGSPVVEVAIGADGRLIDATVQRGSGHTEIDQAALTILRLASPFEPFPSDLARQYDALRFAYQWEFFGGQLGSGVVTAGSNGTNGP